MNMTMFLLMGLFAFSCGNTPTEKTTTVEPEKEIETIVQVKKKEVSIVPEISETEKTEMKTEVVTILKTKVFNKESRIEPTKTSEIITSDEILTETPTKTTTDEIQTEPSITPPEKEKTIPEKIIKLSAHADWNTLLKKYVTDAGNVDYKNFKNDISSLDSYLKQLAENGPANNWSKKERLAYYINLYNAATVKLILDNYPIKSIKDINKPWGKKWVRVGNTTYSLGNIEHKILRKMNEPRIHFAINCASYSCPKLLNVAFTAANMETLLQKATIEFINDTKRNKISTNKVQLSNIFKWYKKDFTGNGTLIEYLNTYLTTKINDNSDIDYLKYDWSLNEAK